MKFDYKKSLGQNFLKDNNIITKIVSSINPNKDDLIIEIGPGSGALTRRLIKKNCDIKCFEIDKRLQTILNNIKYEKLEVYFEDFLKININDYITKNYKKIYFVGNLPYYITTAIINKITNESNPYEIVIMIQKEVAQRFMASVKTKQYSSISVFLQYNYNISKVCDVSKNCFEPIPKVDSTVIKLRKKDNNIVIDEDHFYKLIKDSFKYKRKNLKNNLKSYNLNIIEEELKKYDKSLTNRAEEISIEEFASISNKLVSHR